VSNLGSTLVALGNAGASTEKQILDMSLRIAGAGKLVGASEGEVLALANAMASVGIEAQLGGGVMSRVMQRMYGDVMEGGEGLQNLADTAGVSSKEFATAFETDPVRAVDMVVKGLGRVKDEGGNVIQTMTDLGIKGTEETSVLLRLAGAGDLLTSGLEMQGEAWESNTALLAEATKRYETTEAKITIAWNNIKDSAITAGGAMLPVVSGLADGAIGLADAFSKVPEPVQGGLTMLAGVAGVSALAAGGLLMFIPRAAETVRAFKDLNQSGSKIPGVMGKIGKAAGIAAGGLVAFEVIKGLHNSVQPGTASLEEFTQALIKLDDHSGAIDDMFSGIDMGDSSRWAGEITSAGDALSELINQDFAGGVESFGATVLGIDNGMSKMADAVTKADQSIAAAATSGNMDLAADGFKAIAESAEAQGVTLEEVFDRFPEYKAALLEQASAAGESVEGQDLLNWAMGETPDVMIAAKDATDEAAVALEEEAAAAEEAARLSEEMAEALDEIGVSAEGTVTNLTKFTNALVSAGLLSLSSRDSARQYQASIDALNETIATNGATLDINTEAGRANEAALDGIASAGLAYAEALATETDALGRNVNSQEDVQAALKQTYDDYYANALAMTGNADAAEALTRKVMGIPDDVSIDTFMAETAKLMADATTGAVDVIPESVHISASMDHAAKETADATKKSADDIPEQETIDSWMSDKAFIEAVRTRAAALGIPEEEAIDSFMSSAARNEADATTAQVLGIPEGASVSSFMDAYARAEAERLTGALNAIDGRRVVATAIMQEITERQVIDLGTSRPGTNVLPGQMGMNAFGGRIPALAGGGRLPTTGPGTDRVDGILGVSSKDGTPVSWLDGGEHITSEAMTNKYSDLLWAIHLDDPRLSSIPRFAGGGRPGSREYAVSSARYGAGSAPALNLVAYVQNPWTGEQVQAVVKHVATATADDRINEQARRSATRRNGARG
jgi:TP901 family phage tail tape measure protein